MILKVFFSQLGSEETQNREFYTKERYINFVDKIGFEKTFKIKNLNEFLNEVNKQKKLIYDYFENATHVVFVSSTPFSKRQTDGDSIISQILEGARKNIEVINISEACTGFETALNLCNQILKEKNENRAIIMTLDHYSIMYDTSETKLSSLFSDALTMTSVINFLKYDFDYQYHYKGELIDRITYSDGSLRNLLYIENDKNLKMQGQGLLVATITEVPRLIKQLLERNQISINEVSQLILHQASKLICEAISSSVQYGRQVFFAEKMGNTVSGSIPLVLRELGESQEKILIVSFGMGFKCNLSLWNSNYE